MTKKTIVLALAAILVVAFAASAMAATKVDFSGTFRVRAMYLNNRALNGNSDHESKRSFLDQRLRINFKLMPTENLTLNVGLTTEDQVWGQQGTANYATRPVGTVGANESSMDLEVRFAWMTVKTPFGAIVDIGRMPAYSGGLANLGYFGSDVMGVAPFDNSDEDFADRIMVTYPMGPFTLAGYYEKKVERDLNTGELAITPANNRKYDQDWDQWAVTGTYKFANGGATLTVAYDDNRGGDVDQLGNGANGFYNTTYAALLANTPAGQYGFANASDINAYYWTFNPALALNFGPVGLHGEMAIVTGQAKWKWLRGNPPSTGAAITGNNGDIKDTANINGFGAYADVTYNFGPGVVGLQYSYVSGDKTTTDYNIDGMALLGWDHAPFLVFYDRTLIAGDRSYAWNPTNGGTNLLPLNNHWMLGGWIDYAVQEDLTLHAAFGYFQANEAGKNLITNKDVSKNIGSEFDVSAVYTIMPNLTFQMDLGYFWGGDYWKQGWDESAAAQAVAGYSKDWAKVGNSYMMKNTLTLKF